MTSTPLKNPDLLISPDLTDSYQQRFGGVARLYGQQGLAALAKAHMTVIGLGGVGSWAAEALARSGVGELTLVEMDDVCVTNTNRQLHALQSTVGYSKLEVMATRLRDINPELRLHLVENFVTKKNLTEIIHKDMHIVIDAMDSVHTKTAVAAFCSALKVRLIIVGSSGGKLDPTQITYSDLGFATNDPMLAKIRTQLYRHYKFAKDTQRKFRIDAIYSMEKMVYPKPDGTVCQKKTVMDKGVKLDCAGGFGSVTMVTGSFGFVAASRAIKRYLKKFSDE